MKLGRIVKYLLTIIIFTSLQVTLCRKIAIYGIIPNIVLPLIVAVSVVDSPLTGAVIGLIFGIFSDSLSSGITVIYSLTYMYLAIISGNITNNYLRKNLGTAMMFTFLGTVIVDECIHFLHFAIWGVSGVFSAIIYPILPTAVYSTLAGIPIYYFTKRFLCKNNGRDYT